MMQDNAAMWDHLAAGGPPGQAAAHPQPIVTMSMLACVMCANQFSMSGKLSDHRTPVLAVNPSASIEGPYCIACAGKREGLRSFQIDEARVALVKLMHQQLSTGAAYAYAALHHQQAAQQQQCGLDNNNTSNTNTGMPPYNNSNHNGSGSSCGSGNTNNHNGHAPYNTYQQQQQQQAKQDAPGLLRVASEPPGQQLHANSNLFSMALPQEQQQQQHNHNNKHNNNNNKTWYSKPTTNHHNHHNHTSNKRQKVNPSNYVKTTWSDEEDRILIQAVTTSPEQPFTRWSDLANLLPGRIGKQIRDRWLNHLDPKIDRSPFTKDEDYKLYMAFKKHGKRWVEISTKYFDSKRSENHIKNRWYSAAFKKFVKAEWGEDPFNNSSTTTTTTATTTTKKGKEEAIIANASTSSSKQEPPGAEERQDQSSELLFLEEKKEASN
ncbi:Myb-related protein A [Seminavis robusta]|uniref:Myb-related protein A n=1 Tax=Seminavis robusta TaxID=568900 RepID=A0A9N8H9C9_9STRA|nr:Myb-related protein A [Seminavis robusta]|eukprot:Sro187_g080920.1 Myb-related protein A (435) ;mRNA; f:41786-43090